VVAPVLLVSLLIGRGADDSSVGVALPLLAVPVAAMVAELISHLARQSDAASSRSARRLQQLARLEDVLRRFRRPGSLAQAADQVAEAAREIFQVERSTVVLRDSAGELISVSSGPIVTREPTVDTAQLVAKTIVGDQPQLVPTGTNGTILVLPLPAPEAPAGAVLVYPAPTDDPDFTLDLARLFGVQIGIAIEHLFVIDELARATTRDALTGIGNRKHADALLRSMQPGDALVLLDLDGFKMVNDTLGHSAGDQVLQDLSAHLRDCLRDSDTSARLGGDEFLIVARRAHADPLAVASRVLEGWADKAGPTTLSAGVALHQVDPTDPHTLDSQVTFERADRALYQAKAKGKNRAQLWSQPRSESAST
jgi:diguanylate cyclase (GGDEF)-like protein